MKGIILMVLSTFLFCGCASSQNKDLKYTSEIDQKGKSVFKDGSIQISNPEVEYEVIIFDNYFESWFARKAKPRGFYSKAYLESKNRQWILSFNANSRAGKRGFDYTIDYQLTIDYGYEVNYMLYNYLLYFQEVNRVRLD